MTKVCRDLLGLPGKLGNRRGHQRQRFREETRVIQESPAHQVTPAIQDLPVPLVARKETRENQGRLANEANQAKMVTPVPQASLESKESLACQVLQDGMERGELKVIVDIQAPQEW